MNRTVYYLLHPLTWISYQLEKYKLRRKKKEALKAVEKRIAGLKEMELQLKAAAYPACSKCYGQGQKGFNIITKEWVPCRCTYNPRTQDRLDAHSWLKS